MTQNENLPDTPPWSRELIKAIAKDIGDAVLAHVQTMYPQAIEAAPSTFPTSLRNCVHNEILAAVSINDVVLVAERLRERKQFRRKVRADFQRMRNATVGPRGARNED
jgi:hypothetical protein